MTMAEDGHLPTKPNGSADGELAAGAPSLVSSLYEELRRLARHHLRGERADHTLQTTAVVHEAYLRLAKTLAGRVLTPAQFMALSASTIRRVLIDYSRARSRSRRGGRSAGRIALDPTLLATDAPAVDLLDLDAALERLTALDERQAKVVEMRFFGGMTEEQIAEILELSRRTVQIEWRAARAWLRRELSRDNEGTLRGAV